ncbi:gp53 [Sphingomonas phage PAU]|uniref:gp53 n=1 Tax=Sphingomonas phage PAU TaxID=1150991 RepID=UPI000257313A|nr:gp53 [Sphingomonas phage PAU]AFF28051.1 gp53 [Sphingomonas phage PAU]
MNKSRYTNEIEYILCAAIWYKDETKVKLNDKEQLRLRGFQPYNIDKGFVVTGWRHGNVISIFNALTGLRSVTFGKDSCGEHTQGFLTSCNRFVDRKEGGEIAFAANQTKELKTYLFSEDLY